MEKSLTPEESLQIIQKSISNSRKNLREGSFYYLLWGIFVTGAIVIQSIALSRERKGEGVVTHLDRYLKIVWILAGLLMGLMVFLSYKVGAFPTPFILGVTAMATGICGLTVRFRPLIIGAIVFLAAAVVAIYVEGTAQLLVLAGALILGYLVPGYLLRRIKNGDDV